MSQGVSNFFLYRLRLQQAFRPTAAGVMSRPGQAEPKMEADLAASVPLKGISNTGTGKAFVTHRGAGHEQAEPRMEAEPAMRRQVFCALLQQGQMPDSPRRPSCAGPARRSPGWRPSRQCAGKSFVPYCNRGRCRTHRGARHEQARPGGAQDGGRAGNAPAQGAVRVDHDGRRAVEQAHQARLRPRITSYLNQQQNDCKLRSVHWHIRASNRYYDSCAACAALLRFCATGAKGASQAASLMPVARGVDPPA